jgi:hypothetical protein
MGLLLLGIAAFYVSFTLQRSKRRWWLSVSVPPLTCTLLFAFDEFVLSRHSGGSSLWPIALTVGTPITLLGSLSGVCWGLWIKRDRRASGPGS